MAQPNKQVRVTYVTPAFRLSYPSLFEPVAVMGNEANKKYSITMLFPKKSHVEALKSATHPAITWMPVDNMAGMYAEICKVARANFGPEVDLKTLKLTKFRDGDKPKDSGAIDENEKGFIVVRASSSDKTKPDCLRQDKTRVTDPGELYPGCWARAVLTIAPFVHKVGGRGVTLYLAGVQKLAEDTTFSSRPRAEDEFDAVATETQGADGAGVQTPSNPDMPWLE